jgi:hypothetical protein
MGGYYAISELLWVGLRHRDVLLPLITCWLRSGKRRGETHCRDLYSIKRVAHDCTISS